MGMSSSILMICGEGLGVKFTGGKGVWIHDMSTLPTDGISLLGVRMNLSAVKRSLKMIAVRVGVISRSVYSPMPWEMLVMRFE